MIYIFFSFFIVFPSVRPVGSPVPLLLSCKRSFFLTRLFVVPDKVPQRIPMIGVDIDIIHTAPQTRLQVLGMPPEEVHHHSPRQRRERRPRVVADLRAQRLLGDDGEARARLDGYAREGEDDAREDVDDDLLADGGDFAGALGAAAEDDVAS